MRRWYRFSKNMFYSLLAKRTIGARILLIQDNKVLLVKHTYQPGWYTIGGGVERGESPLQAIHRELKEEVGATLTIQPHLFAVYYSQNEKRDDYVVLYVGTKCQQQNVRCAEILEQRWFDLDNLPPDITPATQRRIDEYLGRIHISDTW